MRLRGVIARAAEAALGAIPVRAWEALAPQRAIALCYHMVSDAAVPHVRPLFAYKSERQFEQDAKYLRRRYDVLSDADLSVRLESTEGGGRSAAAITFDDGLQECHSIVRPILARTGVRAIFFLTTGCLDNKSMIYRHQAALCVHSLLAAGGAERGDLLDAVNRGLRRRLDTASDLATMILGLRADRASLLDEITGLLGLDVQRYLRERAPYLTRAQARELGQEGHGLGAHGLTHRDFQVLSESEIEAEIVESCDQVAALSGRTPVPFAVPFTLDGLDRARLQRIQKANPQVGWIYGTSGVRPELHGLFNRLISDEPGRSGDGRSNVSRLVRSALAYQAGTALRGLVRGRRHWREA